MIIQIQKTKLKNKIKDYFLPIENHEIPKFICIALLMFCILGIQNLIRAMKDSIINTMVGTEMISFLKFWGVMPAAFLITILYIKLVNNIKAEKIFYIIISSFLLFFAIFAFYLLPNYEDFHFSKESTYSIIKDFPNFKWFILIFSNWSFSLFYIIAELWPNVVFALLFWQFVNKIINVEESKRFYPVFGIIGQTGLYFSGAFLEKLIQINEFLKTKFNLDIDNNIISIQIVILIVLFLGIVAIITFWLINNKILDNTDSIKFELEENKTSFIESIKMVLKSKYIGLITILLVSYGMTINLVEGPWKATVSKIYTTSAEFAAFQGSYIKYTGIFTLIFVIIGSNIIRKLGWFSGAMMTPLILFITGMMFFITINFDSVSIMIALSFAITDPLLIAIFVGSIQNILSKSTKYTLFDSTKEMSYVPLSPEIRTKGKAAADVIGTKLGKSMSALLQSMIFIIMPNATYNSISNFLMYIFIFICLIWIWAVIKLNKEYMLLCNNKS